MERHERIALAIEESGLDQLTVAKACGVSAGAISHWKSGNTKDLRLENFLLFCEVTNRSPWWVALGKEPKILDKTNEPDPFLKEMASLDSTERAVVLRLVHDLRKLMQEAVAAAMPGRTWNERKEALNRDAMIRRGNLPPGE